MKYVEKDKSYGGRHKGFINIHNLGTVSNSVFYVF
jgi:hypothetical protein